MCSDCYEVRSGVPQGNVLGPLLYLLFTADLPTTDYTTIAIFADDTGLLALHRDPAVVSQRLQSHLTLLHNWFTLWKIRVNPRSLHMLPSPHDALLALLYFCTPPQSQSNTTLSTSGYISTAN